jgi:hypothetical protein
MVTLERFELPTCPDRVEVIFKWINAESSSGMAMLLGCITGFSDE